MRSPVYRKLPVRTLARLHEAIVLRPAGMNSAAAIAAHFDLPGRYGISVAMLKTYAARVEEMVRPAVTSQVLAGVLGCLPESHRRRLIAGSEVLLVSKMLQALEHAGTALSVAEMAKLGSILGSLGRRESRRIQRPSSSGTPDASDSSVESKGHGTRQSPIKLAETVRLLYGLSWPPEDAIQATVQRAKGPGPDGNDVEPPVK